MIDKILCIDSSVIHKEKWVQKKIPLGSYLTHRTAFRDVLEADEKWLPLNFATAVRSIRTNRVLCKNILGIRIAYDVITNVKVEIHKGYDLAMFLASQGFMNFVDADNNEVQELMSRGSTYQCCGLYYGDNTCPTVYSNILISDEYFPILSKHYKKDVEDVSIKDLKNRDNVDAFVADLIEI